MHLSDSKIDDTFLHPLCDLQFLDELVLDVGYDLISERFGLGRKGLFDEETTQNPAEPIIYMSNTGSPSLWSRIGVLNSSDRFHEEQRMTLPFLAVHS